MVMPAHGTPESSHGCLGQAAPGARRGQILAWERVDYPQGHPSEEIGPVSVGTEVLQPACRAKLDRDRHLGSKGLDLGGCSQLGPPTSQAGLSSIPSDDL